MSVALLLQYPRDPRRPTRLVPVATEETFERYWGPLCEALELHWVRQFQYGVSITQEHLQEVLDELRTLEQSLLQAPRPDWPDGAAAHLLERIALVREALEGVRGDPDVEVYAV